MRLFDFDVFNPMKSSDEVIGVVVVLIWVITYPADLELWPSMLDSTCPDLLLPTLRLCPIHPSQLCQYSIVSLTQKMSPSQVEEFPTAVLASRANPVATRNSAENPSSRTPRMVGGDGGRGHPKGSKDFTRKGDPNMAVNTAENPWDQG